jgi:hypothetical protein
MELVNPKILAPQDVCGDDMLRDVDAISSLHKSTRFLPELLKLCKLHKICAAFPVSRIFSVLQGSMDTNSSSDSEYF